MPVRLIAALESVVATLIFAIELAVRFTLSLTNRAFLIYTLKFADHPSLTACVTFSALAPPLMVHVPPVKEPPMLTCPRAWAVSDAPKSPRESRRTIDAAEIAMLVPPLLSQSATFNSAMEPGVERLSSLTAPA